jgi:arylsulfatase A-like enzyme
VITPMPMTDPAHASILTGLHPRTHGIRMNGHTLADPSIPTLASWARGLGYRTAAFVSRAHLLPSELRLQGFEHEEGPQRPQRIGGKTAASAMAWMRAHRGDPMFVWVHLFDPHAPYAAPPPFGDRFSERGDRAPSYRGNEASRDPYPPAEVRAMTACYDNEIAYADDLAGRLVALADEIAPPGNPPLVVVTADHGETLGERDLAHRYAFDHGQLLYQDVLEVPLILRRPGALPPGHVLPGPVSLIDVAPTIIELVGAEGFATHGRSLVGDIHGHEQPGSTRLVFTERRLLPLAKQLRWRSLEQFSVQNDRYKLILSTPFSRTQLYDLQEDPTEAHDLAQTLPAVEAELRGALEHWRASLEPAGDTSPGVPPEKARAMRALGYVD